MGDTLRLTMVGMGHGDCFLLEWQPASGDPWTALIDGGPKATGVHPLRAALGERPIDKVVLTHVDADHLAGLFDLPPTQVKEFWGPCLPAFRRHAWLFPPRVMNAVERSATLESKLAENGTRILYPLEGYRDASPDGRLKVRVLSPPTRLIDRLLWSEDATDLFLRYPTPMGWLLQPEPERGELQAARTAMRAQMVEAAYLTPRDVSFGPATAGRPSDGASLRDEWCQEYDAHPEFFGNHVLNDSSIVLWIEALFDGQTLKRILFPGDLENWVYLSARHGTTLACDLLKAPHHGGRVYLEKHTAIAFDEVYQQLRPRIVVVSGCGRHDLPRGEFRETVARWGGTLICSSQRNTELIVGHEGSETSCFKRFRCSSLEGTTTITITRDRCEADRPACLHVPSQGAIPVVLLKQHVIDPSPLLERFTEGELHKHMEWIAKQLRKYHEERVRVGSGSGADAPVSADTLADTARSAGSHRLVAELTSVLQRAMREGRIWCGQPPWDRGGPDSYILPTHTEEKSIISWVRSFRVVTLVIKQEKGSKELGPRETLAHADTSVAAALTSEKHRFPGAMFRAAIWPFLSKELLNGWNAYLSASRDEGHRRILFCFKKSDAAKHDQILSEVLVPTRLSPGSSSPYRGVWYCNWNEIRSRSQGIWPSEAAEFQNSIWIFGDPSGIEHAVEVKHQKDMWDFQLAKETISLW
jgi:Metallo-beta-lactamase superfamily